MKKYETPEIDIRIILDVIATSGGGNNNDDDDPWTKLY